MSGETLRRAAALMRERAEAADTSGAWEVGRRYERSGDWTRPVYDDDGTVCEIHEGDAASAPESCEGLAAHIASWHPAVALAIADLLEVFAMMPSASDPTDMTVAVNLANTYLGESA